MKKFWKYFIILILLLSGLACIGLLYLFFVRDSSLFNITYISYSDEYETGAYIPTDDSGNVLIHTIKLSNDSYDVDVVSTTSPEISAIVYAKTFGYTLVKNSKVSVTSNLADGVLTIDVEEPHGFAFDGFSTIELKIPETINPNLILKNRKAKTTITDPSTTLSSLQYSTKSGNIKLANCSILGNMNLSLGRSNFEINSSVNLLSPSVKLKLTSGKFLASSHDFNTIEITKNTRGIVKVKNCNMLVESVKTAGGKIDIESVNDVHIESSDTNVEIDNLTNGYISLSRSGKIRVKNLLGEALLKTDSGSIKVDKISADGSLTTYSDTGDQTIKNAQKLVCSHSEYGNISISFAEDAGNYSQSTPFRAVEATTKNGKISVYEADNVNLTINEDGNGRINVEMRNVAGTNKIYGKRGDVSVVIPTNAIYYLTTEATDKTHGSVYVNVGQFTVEGYTIKDRFGPTLICANPDFTGPIDGNLEVTVSSGSLQVLDELSLGL